MANWQVIEQSGCRFDLNIHYKDLQYVIVFNFLFPLFITINLIKLKFYHIVHMLKE